MVRNTPQKEYKILLDDQRFLSKQDSVYKDIIKPYRKVCGLSPIEKVLAGDSIPDFTGSWIFNEDESIIDNMGVSLLPYKMAIKHNEDRLIIEKMFIVEWGDNRSRIDTLALDGEVSETIAEYWNTPQIITAGWSEDKDTLRISTKISYDRNGQPAEMTTLEKWVIKNDGKALEVNYKSESFWGERRLMLIYEKQRLY
ncbi:MAG: hypothetical protein P8X42_06640 [Calditrichaceae bacterium]